MQKLKLKAQSFIEKHPRLVKILITPDLRTDASLYLFSGISLVCTLTCILSGFFSNTRWFTTLGVFNFILALIRLVPAFAMRRRIEHPLPPEQRAAQDARLCQIAGILLLSVNLAFIGITAETIIRNHALHYHPIILFFLVPFSFISFILLSIDVIRKRREGATLNRCLRIINMSIAMVSLYITQTAVLATYVSNELARLVLNLISSSLIFLVLLRLSVNLILTARKALHQGTTDHP